MGIVLFVGGAVIAVVLAMLLGGLMLPARVSVRRVLHLRAGPDAVWSLVADPAGYPAWRDDISAVDIDGVAPLRWHEFGDDGALGFEATAVVAPSHFRAVPTDDDVARRLQREYRLEPEGDGTRLDYHEQRTVTNPIARFMFRYVLRSGGTVDRQLGRLAAALDEPGTPTGAD